MNGMSAMKSSCPRVSSVYRYRPNGNPVRVEDSSATSATGQTHAVNPSVRRQPRSATAAPTKTARNANTYGRRRTVPSRRSIREGSVVESACYHHVREGPAGRDRARPGAPARPTGSRRSLGRSARSQLDDHFRAAAALPSPRPGQSRPPGARRPLPQGRAASRRRLQSLRGRSGQPVGDDQGVLRDEDGRRAAERSHDGRGAVADPRDGRPGQGRRVHEDLAGALRRVRLERGADDAGRDHAAAAAVFLFNIYEISYWSRTVLVPLLVLLDRKPVKWLPPHLSLDELWPVPREETSLRFSRVPEPF